MTDKAQDVEENSVLLKRPRPVVGKRVIVTSAGSALDYSELLSQLLLDLVLTRRVQRVQRSKASSSSRGDGAVRANSAGHEERPAPRKKIKSILDKWPIPQPARVSNARYISNFLITSKKIDLILKRLEIGWGSDGGGLNRKIPVSTVQISYFALL